jgi:DNA repair exonuclease SbcCD ATPase subunit
MLNLELQPAVREVVERNDQLENENKTLSDRIHELMTEVTALKAARGQYGDLSSSQGFSSPDKGDELRNAIQRHKKHIARLQSRVVASQSELDQTLKEKAEISSALESERDQLERSAQLESDAGQKCDRIAKALQRLLGISKGKDPRHFSEDPPSSLDLGASLDRMNRDVEALGDAFARNAQEKKRLLAQNAELQQKHANLTAQLSSLQRNKAVTDECNARYDSERKDLNTAIATLRPALDQMTARFIAADNERKQLKSELERLKQTKRP